MKKYTYKSKYPLSITLQIAMQIEKLISKILIFYYSLCLNEPFVT